MNQDKAFSNVRIIDFTHFLAGPVGSFQFAMHGADVIKVEARGGGEDMRDGGVSSKEWSERRLSPVWMAANAGKRSISLDLTKHEATEIARKLVRDADVVWENFRPGVMDRFGLGWSQLKEINPRLIYCSVSGFGASGPASGTPTFDGKIQAMSGLMKLTGEPGRGPMRVGFPVADMATGIMGAFAVATALYQRTHTGLGQHVDVAILDTVMTLLGPQVAEYSVAGYRHPQYGNSSMSAKPTTGQFRCGDGHLIMVVLKEKQFTNLLRAIGRADALSDPRFVDWPARTKHTQALRELIENAMRDGDPRDWERRLNDAGVPCASVYSIPEILEHPQVKHRSLMRNVQTPHGPVQLVGPAFQMEHGDGEIVGPPPLPGEHTERILASLGYSEAAIARLRTDEVI